ncbi:MAG: hypothetical protein WC609_02395 [Candidatus Paceibacterota bacterium]|jgi:hypothetical protein
MNTLITNAIRTVWNLWGIANFWVRVAIFVIVVSPTAVSLVALAGSPTATAIVVLLPIICIAGIFLWEIDPLVIPILQRTPGIKDAVNAGIKIIKKIVAVEFLMGVYFTLVPIHGRPGFLAPILLVIVAIIALWSSELKWEWAWSGLVMTLVVLTLLVIFPLRMERIEKEGVLPIMEKETRSFLFGPKPKTVSLVVPPAPSAHVITPAVPIPPRPAQSRPMWELRDVPSYGKLEVPLEAGWKIDSLLGRVIITTPKNEVYYAEPGVKIPVKKKQVAGTYTIEADPRGSTQKIKIKTWKISHPHSWE